MTKKNAFPAESAKSSARWMSKLRTILEIARMAQNAFCAWNAYKIVRSKPCNFFSRAEIQNIAFNHKIRQKKIDKKKLSLEKKREKG